MHVSTSTAPYRHSPLKLPLKSRPRHGGEMVPPRAEKGGIRHGERRERESREQVDERFPTRAVFLITARTGDDSTPISCDYLHPSLATVLYIVTHPNDWRELEVEPDDHPESDTPRILSISLFRSSASLPPAQS